MERSPKTPEGSLSGLKANVRSLAAMLTVLAASLTLAHAAMVTVTGRLNDDADDKNFVMRDAVGRDIPVNTTRYVFAEGANKLVEGDVVRVHGEWIGDTLYARNLRYIGKRYIAAGTRVRAVGYPVVVGAKRKLTGTLITDADDDEFEIQDSRGRVCMIRTRTIPDAYGGNKLVKGQRVRVYGRWAVGEDGRAYLEASNFRVL